MTHQGGDRAGLYRGILHGSALLDRPLRDLPAVDGAAATVQYVLAPMMAEFVRWVLVSALHSGKKRLYFLARDGYFMCRAAQLFCTAFSLPAECRYLSVSRHALRLPLLHTDHGWALDAVCRAGGSVTPEQVLMRAGLTAQERQITLEQLHLPYPPDRPIPTAALPELKRVLSQCAFFLQRMDIHSAAALPSLTGYLKQEGLAGGTADAVVDSGWVGSIQEALMRACTIAGRTCPLEGYYFGLYSLPRLAVRSDYHCYYFAPEGDIRRKVYFSSSLFEAALTAPHGTTTGYRESSGSYAPVYAAVSDRSRAFSSGIAAQLTPYLERFAAVTDPADFLQEPFVENRTVLARLIRLFMGEPTRAEAEFFGAIPFSADSSAGEDSPLAARLDGPQLRAWRPTARLFSAADPPGESAWYAGSTVLHGKNIRLNLAGYARYQYARHLRNTYLYRKERNL